jgi:hypothetical protein
MYVLEYSLLRSGAETSGFYFEPTSPGSFINLLNLFVHVGILYFGMCVEILKSTIGCHGPIGTQGTTAPPVGLFTNTRKILTNLVPKSRS